MDIAILNNAAIFQTRLIANDQSFSFDKMKSRYG